MSLISICSPDLGDTASRWLVRLDCLVDSALVSVSTLRLSSGQGKNLFICETWHDAAEMQLWRGRLLFQVRAESLALDLADREVLRSVLRKSFQG